MEKTVFAFGVLCLICLVVLGTQRRRRRKPLKPIFTITINSITVKSTNMAVSFYPGQSVEGTLQPLDRKGNPANVEAGSVRFTSSDESIFTVESDPTNELKVKLVAVAPGVAQLNYSADADLDLGEGEVRTIEGFAAVEVLPEEAVGFGIQFSEPVDQA